VTSTGDRRRRGVTRREVLRRGALVGAALAGGVGRAWGEAPPQGVRLDDVHSQLNATWVDRVVRPGGVDSLQETVRWAAARGLPVSISGGRHAMGGQQFAAGAVHLDMTSMGRILRLDAERGIATVEAGIEWPELVAGLLARQSGEARPWTIIQKQTGADRLSIGGALAANVHGRGLAWAPFVQDVEAFTLIDARGEAVRCSRRENPELFSLAVGGYGLFGPVAEVELRLARRRKLRRVVTTLDVDDLMAAFEGRIDRAAELGGSYFLTYHRWARRDQVERCHPRFREFLAAKRRHDPEERFQSDWYRHYRAMFQPLAS
jgi:FAD/FMN-containing dehydrogenase